MSAFETELQRRLQELEQKQLYRRLRRVDSPQGPRCTIEGKELLNFSSNDYLGLSNHEAIKAAACEATERFGGGSGASRLICGSLAPHHELEQALAEFKGTEAALTFSSGYATAVGTIPALLCNNDFVVIDKLVHASIVDGAKLSGATLRVFSHNDLNDLEEILQWCARQRSPDRARHVLVVTESLFSMDGDVAPLADLVALKERYGAWLMVDEAHATGLFGANRRGLIEEGGVSGRVDIQMGTLGKAIGSAGGFIAGSGSLIEYLVNRARSFIFSTAPAPAGSAAALAGLKIIASPEGEQRLRKLRDNIATLCSRTERLKTRVSNNSPIIPLILGKEARAVEVAERLRERSIFVPAIRYPTVARDSARLRITCSSSHSREDVETLALALDELGAS
jgi:8-amino-7-oxononanoate synthase